MILILIKHIVLTPAGAEGRQRERMVGTEVMAM